MQSANHPLKIVNRFEFEDSKVLNLHIQQNTVIHYRKRLNYCLKYDSGVLFRVVILTLRKSWYFNRSCTVLALEATTA